MVTVAAMGNRLRRTWLIAVLAGALLSLLPAGAASAHTEVDEYTPATGELLENVPSEIVLRFSTDPNPQTLEVSLSHRDGRPVPFTGDEPVFEGREVRLTPPALDHGTYVIVWRSVGGDGHIAAGQSHFSIGFEEIGAVADLTGREPGANLGDTGSRFALYAVLALLLGVFWLSLQRFGEHWSRPTRRALGLLLALAVLVRFVVVAFRAGAGNPVEGATRMLTTMPTVLGWALLALAALAITTIRNRVIGGIALSAAVLGETLSGHIGTAKGAAVLVPVTAFHLAGATLWVGGIAAHLLLGRGTSFARFARRFTPYALAAGLTVAGTGVALTFLRTNLDGVLQILEYTYGRTLAAKWLLLVLFAVPLGAWHMYQSLAPTLQRTFGAAGGEDADPGHSDLERAPQPEIAVPGRKFRRAPLLIEGGALAAVLLLGATLTGLSPNPPEKIQGGAGAVDLLATPRTFEECMDPTSATDQLLCVTRYFEGVVDRAGMNTALLEVGKRWREGDAWMQSNCHSIGHKLGRLGFRMFKDIPKAFSQGSDPCDYGYLHGVIEGASADFSDEKLRSSMRTLCEGTGDTSNHGYRQCIHGLGHAAARRVNNDLARGMEFCREFGSGETVASVDGASNIEDVLFRLCVTGVSMEWNTQPKALDALKLPIGAEGTLMGECIKLDSIFQPGCIEYGTSAMGGIYEREIQARDWCDANLADPLPCYQSIGRDVIWSETITEEQAMEICTGGRKGIYAEQCITRALGSVATIALDAAAIDTFCPYVPEQYKHLCAKVKAVMEVQIEQTVRGFITEPAPNQQQSQRPDQNGTGA